MGFSLRLLKVLAILLVLSGAIFKIQHWKGANMLLLAGIIFTAVVFVIAFIADEIARKNKTS